MGIVLLEAIDPVNPGAGATKKYQDSWTKAGWLAPIQLDEHGNVFTTPAPFINVLNNPAADQNTIYRINGQTGILEPFTKLLWPDSITDQNPYGILGMVYLCETGQGCLWAASFYAIKEHLQNQEDNCAYISVQKNRHAKT